MADDGPITIPARVLLQIRDGVPNVVSEFGTQAFGTRELMAGERVLDRLELR